MNMHGKRPRLYSSHQREFAPSFANQHEYYDELGMDEEGDEEEGEEELDFDPLTELQQRRAELDHRLKNTFEDIFAKYERDFDGIGDEIDLATGEIVVNNGHLVEMMDERDAGLRKGRREMVEDSDDMESFMEEEEEEEEEDGESLEEGEEDTREEAEDDEDENEDEDDEEDATTGETMDDDDLILRGFTQANRFLQASPELGHPIEAYNRPPIPRPQPKPKPRRSLQSDTLPSHSDILAQFGPDIGPQIVGYITQQEKARESHIEPAWRVPDIPSAAPRKRPAQQQQSFFRPREIARSISPEASTSIWAVSGGRGKQKKNTASGMELPGSAEAKRVRNNFTVEEDEAMLEYITKAQHKGTNLFSTLLWKGLAAKYPRHTWGAWQARYRRNFFLSTNSEESENETTPKNIVVQSKKSHVAPPPQYVSDRPNRERKPAQRDSRIISWSQAVDTIASVDPDLHAGILDDARRARNGEVSWVFGRPEATTQRKSSPYGRSSRRPVSASEVDELQRDFGRSRREPARDFSGSRLPLSGASGDQVPYEKPAKRVRAPCPHADCRHLTVHQYRLDRAKHEDMSEMTLHLLRDHHTTPFPCEEDDCLQTGERGYFIQEDLVKHVKAAHPDDEALDRLTGRVDSSLLGKKEEQVCIDLTNDSPDSNKNVIRHNSSGFVRSSNAHSNSDILSSTPGNNRTLTPATIGETTRRASISTPLTSFSSLAVNRSSIAAQGREISDSQEPQLPPAMDIPRPTTSITRNDSLEPGFPSSRMNSFGPNPIPTSWSKGPTSEPNQSFGFSSDPFLPEPIEVIVGSKPNNRHHRISQSPYLEHQSNTPHNTIANMQTVPDSESSVLPEILPASKKAPNKTPQASSQPLDHNALPNSSSSKSKKNPAPKHKDLLSETFTRNVIHPSHEFSDDEGSMPPPKSYHLSAPAKVMESFVTPSLPLPVTPTVKRRAPKSAIQRVMQQDDDLDELSLGPDDFKIISSHTKPLPPLPAFGTYVGIKREPTVGPSMSSVTTSRKRRFSDLAPDDIDELGADECFGKSTGTKRIKKEVDLNGTPMVHRIKAQRKLAKKLHRDESKNGPMGLPLLPSGSAIANRQIGRSGTPLLDLTPDKRQTDSFGNDREILDSDDSMPSSSLRQSLSAAAFKPLDGLLTPTRSKQGSLDPLRLAKTAVVVKTPGGTLRKCGEGAFRCGRTFCFRCGHDDIAMVRN